MSPPEPPVSRAPGPVRLDSIKNRIVALALVATLVPALGTALLSYRQNRSALTDTLDSELRGIVRQSAREIDLWIDQRAYEVRVFTGSFEVSENLARIPQGGAIGAEAQSRLTDYLNGVYGRSGDYAGLLVTDAASVPMASTGAVEVSLDALPTSWLAAVRQGEAIVGAPYIDPGLGRTVATLAVPIEAGPLTFVGSLAATVRFDTVDDILAEFAPDEGARVDLVTSTGIVIASSLGSDIVGEPVAAETLQLLAGAEAEAVEYRDPSGTDMVGALTSVPGLEWLVVAQLPAGEAYAEIVQLRNSATVLISIILVVMGVIAYMLGVVIVRPLARLADGADAVAAGDLSVDLPEAGGGEVGHLTHVFNEMVGRLRRSREELDERNRELERLSVTDQLTGLHNRRFLLNAFEREIRRSDRGERPFCVLMLDVDRFKAYNDSHGHLAGDEVLRRMALVLRDATRDLDVLARYGGEEFICLLPECDVENAVLAGERIRARLAREVFAGGPVTISIGAAEFPTHGDSAGAVIGQADEALYAAKAAGRNQVKGAPPRPAEVVKESATRRTASAKKKRGAAKRPAAKTPKTPPAGEPKEPDA